MKPKLCSESRAPYCECGRVMHYASANGRDMETMGGYEMEYFHCPDCDEHYEMIDGELYPSEPPKYSDND